MQGAIGEKHLTRQHKLAGDVGVFALASVWHDRWLLVRLTLTLTEAGTDGGGLAAPHPFLN
jgi:hypothetical protein